MIDQLLNKYIVNACTFYLEINFVCKITSARLYSPEDGRLSNRHETQISELLK